MRAALVLLLIAAPIASAQAGNPDYERAIQLIEARRQTEAIPLLRKAIESDPKNAQYWKALGVAYAGMGDLRSAIEPFEQACTLNQRIRDVCFYYGRALYALNRFEEALLPLTKAAFSDKVRGRAETALGECYEALGRSDEAENRFLNAIKRRDEALNVARLAYARFLIRAGRTEESLEPLRDVLKNERDSAEANYQMARALLQLERMEASLQNAEAAVHLMPASPTARLLLARVYRRLGRDSDAQRQEEAAAELQARGAQPEQR